MKYTIHVGTTNGQQVGESNAPANRGERIQTDVGSCRVITTIGYKILVEGRPSYPGEPGRAQHCEDWERDAW